MARILAVVCVATVVVWGSFAQGEAESREWSDSTGKFKIQAKLLEVKDGKASLLKADGKKVEIPVDKLSAADQKYIEDNDNPFATPTTSATPSTPVPSGKGVPPGKAWAPPNFKALRQVPGLSKTDKKAWALEPVPTTAELADRVELPIFDFHDSPSGVLSVNGEWYALSLKNPFKNHRLCLCNLKTGEVVATGEAEKDSKHLVAAVSPDGKFVLTHYEVWANKEVPSASIWTVEGSELKKQFDWKPFDAGGDGGYWKNKRAAVTWGAFADPQRMLLMADGYLVNWDPTTGRAIYQSNLKPNLLKLLPNGQHLLAVTNDAIGVMDVVAGKLLFYKGMDVHGASSIDISPDGTKLLVHQGSGVKILDFATGEPIKDILVEGANTETVWAGNNHILVGGKDLLDIEREFVCWTYTGQKTTFTAGGKVWFLAVGSGNRPSALISADLPHAEALQRIQEAERDPSFFALRPGTKVNILVDVPGGPVDLRMTLQKKLEAAGYVYDALADITLTAKGYPGQSREITVRDFGAFRGTERKYQFQTNITLLQMVRDGTVLWSRSAGSYPPPIFNVQGGESEADALKRYEAPNMGIYTHSVLPKFIVNPGRAGKTEVTADGL